MIVLWKTINLNRCCGKVLKGRAGVLVLILSSVQESLCGLVTNCNITENKFEFELCYCVDFWTNALQKGMNLIIPQVCVK